MAEKNVVEVIIRAKDEASKELKGINVDFKKLAIGAAAVGAAMTAAAVGVFKFTEGVAQTLDKLNKVSIQTGFTVEALTQLRFAADQNKTEFSAVSRSLLIFSRNLFDLSIGIGEVKDVLPALGIELKDLAGLSTEQAFQKLALAIGNLEDSGKRTAIAMRVFGRAGGELVPLFIAMAKGGKDYNKIADEMGITISTKTALAAEKMVDAMGQLKLQTESLKATLAGELMPVFTDLVIEMHGGLAELIAWVKGSADFKDAARGIGDAIVGTVKSVMDFTKFLIENRQAVELLIKAGGVLALGHAVAALVPAFLAAAAAVRVFTVSLISSAKAGGLAAASFAAVGRGITAFVGGAIGAAVATIAALGLAIKGVHEDAKKLAAERFSINFDVEFATDEQGLRDQIKSITDQMAAITKERDLELKVNVDAGDIFGAFIRGGPAAAAAMAAFGDQATENADAASKAMTDLANQFDVAKTRLRALQTAQAEGGGELPKLDVENAKAYTGEIKQASTQLGELMARFEMGPTFDEMIGSVEGFRDKVEEARLEWAEMQGFTLQNDEELKKLIDTAGELGPSFEESLEPLTALAAELKYLHEQFEIGPSFKEMIGDVSDFSEGMTFATEESKKLGGTLVDTMLAGATGMANLSKSITKMVADLGKAIIKFIFFKMLLKSIPGLGFLPFKSGGTVPGGGTFAGPGFHAGGVVPAYAQAGLSILGAPGPDRVPIMAGGGEIVLPTIGGLKPADVVSGLARLGDRLEAMMASGGGQQQAAPVNIYSLDAADGVRAGVRHGRLNREWERSFDLER